MKKEKNKTHPPKKLNFRFAIHKHFNYNSSALFEKDGQREREREAQIVDSVQCSIASILFS